MDLEKKIQILVDELNEAREKTLIAKKEIEELKKENEELKKEIDHIYETTDFTDH